ncbi:hypothetical protein RRG08_018766 [Elysia crispata]|uniref:Uncharacterized protein n=1 Tax=Elysia crispata TaxID=231223 RepID=A0AAE1B1N7_9GAST|nr:hypothetical protein RRG08_018766 [Elysia crispata]
MTKIGCPRLSTSPNPNAVFHQKAQPKDFHLNGMHHLPEWTARHVNHERT